MKTTDAYNPREVRSPPELVKDACALRDGAEAVYEETINSLVSAIKSHQSAKETCDLNMHAVVNCETTKNIAEELAVAANDNLKTVMLETDTLSIHQPKDPPRRVTESLECERDAKRNKVNNGNDYTDSAIDWYNRETL